MGIKKYVLGIEILAQGGRMVKRMGYKIEIKKVKHGKEN